MAITKKKKVTKVKKKKIDWDDHEDTSPVPWDDLVEYLLEKWPNPMNKPLEERLAKAEKKQEAESEIVDFLIECLDKKYGTIPTRAQERLEIKRKERKCTICPMHGGSDNTTRYGKHSNHGQKQKKSTPRYKNLKRGK